MAITLNSQSGIIFSNVTLPGFASGNRRTNSPYKDKTTGNDASARSTTEISEPTQRFINCIDIDWNGAQWPNSNPSSPSTINTTGDLINAIKWASQQGANQSLQNLVGSTSIGSTNQPIYWNGSTGQFVNTTYTLGTNVPADALFTDTKYKLTLNGTVKGTTGGTDLGTFWAPTNPGSGNNYVLKSNGSNTPPSWYEEKLPDENKGLKLVTGTNKFGHSNDEIEAITTEGLYKIKFDKFGHITGYSVVTVNDLRALLDSIYEPKSTPVQKQNLTNFIVSMSGWTYGGTASNPSVDGNTGNGAVTYEYKVSTAADSTYSGTKPSNAGTYTVKATVAETANYYGATATTNFTIAKANLSNFSVSMSGWTEGQTASNPSVSGNTGNGAVTYTYKVSTAPDSSYSETKPSTAGTYTVKATVAATTNYNSATATANFTISAAQPQETYYWYVGYNQDAYDNPQGFKSNMYTTTTNSMPTEYTKTGNNGLNVASTGTTPNYLIMIIPSSWTKPEIYTQLKDAEIIMTLENQNISITGISGVTFNVYSGTGLISDSQVFIN